MSRTKLCITGQSNQVLRHPIRSCYGMILQACEGNKEKSIYNSVLNLLVRQVKTRVLGVFFIDVILESPQSGTGYTQFADDDKPFQHPLILLSSHSPSPSPGHIDIGSPKDRVK